MIPRLLIGMFGIAAAGFAVPVLAESTPPPQPPQQPSQPPPDPDVGAKCPESIDCMPVLDKERAERCAWVRKHCPETKIWQ